MVLLHNPRANYESPINVTLDLFHIETSQSRRCQDDEPSDTSCAIILTCCRDLSYCGCTKFPSAADNYLQTKYCLGFCLISPPRRSLFLRSSALIFFFFLSVVSVQRRCVQLWTYRNIFTVYLQILFSFSDHCSYHILKAVNIKRSDFM